MQDLFLKFDFDKLLPSIQLDDPLLFMGSCFSENMGSKFSENLFSTAINPCGTYYHPLSISEYLNRLLEDRNFQQSDLVAHDGLYMSWHHHHTFFDKDKETLLARLNTDLVRDRAYLQDVKFIFITWGSAHAYFLKEENKMVDNCHKLPNYLFDKKLILSDEIYEAYSELIEKFEKHFPQIRFIFTISPVRYKKDGLMENNISKAQLFSAWYALQQRFQNISYFPAYELLVDVLRDYRFYAEDGVHPNALAVDKIWEIVQDKCLDSGAQLWIKKWQPLLQASQHKIYRKEGEEFKKFVAAHIEKISNLEKEYPQKNLDPIKNYFNSL